ncbi:MAG: SDR family oxidoreductase [Pseudomonadales bacterium]|nr:SDR family oxidoreductase [Pseudomonadales bacterium]
MKLDLENKTVLVTGSNRGTGNIIANMFLDQGADVFFHSNTEGDSQKAVDESGAGTALWGDITCDQGAESVTTQFRSHADHLDILVNNYGEARRGNWDNTTSEDWIELYNINTLSIVRLTQGVLPLMPRGGRIINLGTIGSTRPNRIMPHYYAAKGALATLTVSLAKETGPLGITTNLVSPGLIRTPEVEASYLEKAKNEGWGETFEEAEQKLAEKYFPNPLGRFATREEVAGIILFLASREAAFINGQNIRVDGGAVDIV